VLIFKDFLLHRFLELQILDGIGNTTAFDQNWPQPMLD
jgi:hypothetical protein